MVLIFIHMITLSQQVKVTNYKCESLGHPKERNNGRNDMLGIQILFIYGFGTSKFHIWHSSL